MKDLAIRLTGQIQESNFDEWKTELIEKIKGANKKLVTDDDFTYAESTVKSFKAAENSLVEAKQSALEQAADIQKLFGAIDEISAEARQARLSLERQIRTRKEEIKNEIIDNGVAQIEERVQYQSDDYHLAFPDAHAYRGRFSIAVKGKKTVKSMNDAVSNVYDEILAEINEANDRVIASRKALDGIEGKYKPLFQDERTLLVLPADFLQVTIEKRIATYEAEEAKRKQAELEREAQEKNKKLTKATPEPTQKEELQVEPEITKKPQLVTTQTKSVDDLLEAYQITILIHGPLVSAKSIATQINKSIGERDDVIQIRLTKSQEAA